MIKKRGFSFPLWNAYFSLREQCFLFLFVLVGMALRIINAIYTPFWRDEIYIFHTARTNTLWQLVTQQHWDTAHPPLHSIFLHFWQLVSIEPLWLRLPSLLISFIILYLLPVFAVYINRKIKALPFVFLFLFAISHTQISLDMVSRPYPFVSLLTFLSLLLALHLYNKDEIHFKQTIPFMCVNILGFCIDYSFMWLFFTYFFVFAIHLLTDKKKRVIITMTQALILIQIILIPVFFSLYSNLSQSLYLESGARMKFTAPPKTNIKMGTQLNIAFSFHEKKPTMFVGNSHDIVLKKQAPWIKPLLSDTQYLGFNIPPLSGMIVTQLAYCPSGGSGVCKKYDDYLHTLRVSHLKSVFSRRIGSYMILFNFHPTDWKNFTFPIVTTKNTQKIVIRTSFIPLRQDPSAEIVFVTSAKKNLMYLNPKEVKSLIHIKSRNFHYEASFYEKAQDFGATVIDGFTFFDKFGNDLLFFSGLPSFSKNNYSHLSLLLIALSILTLCGFLKRHISFEYTLLLSLFFVPLLSSYVLSVVISPIFVGRNLYVVSFSYLFGIALMIAALIDEHRNVIKTATGYLIIIFFAYVLLVKFPFLHYVDPPYEIDTLVERILDSDKEKKKIVVFDRSSQFEALFHYQLLLKNKKVKNVAVIDLESFEALIKDLNIDLSQKRHYEYYFISFSENTDPFRKSARFLECKMDEVKLTYTILTRCHY